jgi:hypothetical protein
MAKIYEALSKLCQEEGWEIIELDNDQFLIDFEDDAIDGASCFAHCREKQNQFIFYSVLFDNIKEESRAKVNEFLTRFNNAVAIGNFEIDLDTGTVRYRTSFDFDKTEATPDLIAPMIYANTTIVKKFLQLIFDVASDKTPPAEAFKQTKLLETSDNVN